MNMADGEIITAYRQAKDHKAQISILADLNGCDRAEMEQHLAKLGCIHATPPPGFDYLRAAELYAEGKSDLEISEQLGVEKAKVGAWRRSKNLAANYPKQRAPVAKAKPAQKLDRRSASTAEPSKVLTVGRLAELFGRLAADAPEAAVLADGAAITTVTMLSHFGSDGNAQRVEVRLETGGGMVRNGAQSKENRP